MVSRGRKVALGGVLGALCIAFLYLAAYLPTSRLFLYGVSSVFCSIILIENGHKWAWAFFAATSALGFMVIPDKLDIVPYLIFFGYYGIIKYYIEGLSLRVIQLVVKGVFFAAALFLGYLLVKELFVTDVITKIPVWLLGAAALAVFYLYDYVYSRFVIYYETSLRKKINR